MARPFSYDTAVFLYARGREHPYRQPCRSLLERVRADRIRGHASVEVVQEYAHVLLRRGHPPREVTAAARDVAAVCTLQPFDEDVLDAALDLIDRVPRLGMRDAVHAATALLLPQPAIVAADRIFDDVPGLRRVDPSDAVAYVS